MELKELTALARNPETTAEQLMDLAGRSDSVDRLLAKHASASPELLEQLSHSSDRTTRKAVAIHPNASKAVLLRLAPQFPGDFFKNPVFDWLLLEDPNLLFEIGGGVLKNVLKRAECPVSFMTWAAAHGSEQEQLAVAMNPKALGGVLQPLLKKGGRVAEAARQHANIGIVQDEEDLEDAFRAAFADAIASTGERLTLAQWPDYPVDWRLREERDWETFLCFGLTHQLAPSELVNSIFEATKENSELRETLASSCFSKNLALPEKFLIEFSRSETTFARLYVADCTSTPPQILAALAEDAQSEVRQRLAKNPSIPQEVLARLAIDIDRDVRSSCALNAAIPVKLIKVLANDSDVSVRSSLIYNSSTTVDIREKLAGSIEIEISTLWRLAKDSDEKVRIAVAGNPTASAELLTILAGDSSPHVRKQVSKNHVTPPEVQKLLDRGVTTQATQSTVGAIVGAVSGFGKKIRMELAKSIHTHIDLLVRLGDDSEIRVREAVAKNSSTSIEMLHKFSQESPLFFNYAVHEAVASHRSCPLDLLIKLGECPSVQVRKEVIRNKNFSMSYGLLKTLANDSDDGIRLEIARSRATPADLLEKLANDKDKSVRTAVAKNSNTSQNTLIKLGRDLEASVLEAISKNPATPSEIVAGLVRKACQEFYYLVGAPRKSKFWIKSLRSFERRDPDLFRACQEGDFLYLSDRMAEKACRKKDLSWRILGLSHRLAAPDVLAKRSRSTEWIERFAVARNPNTPLNVIQTLKKDANRLISRQAAVTASAMVAADQRRTQLIEVICSDSVNQNLLQEIRLRLKTMRRPDWRLYVSRWNQYLEPGQWLLLLSDREQSRLEMVLPESLKQSIVDFWSDPAVPFEILTGSAAKYGSLWAGEEYFFRPTLERDNRHWGVNLPSALSLMAENTKRERVLWWIGMNPNSPSHLLVRLAAKHPSFVAANSGAPLELLRKLENGSNGEVLFSLAKNRSTPVEILERLADEDRSFYGKLPGWVSVNPSTPPIVLAKMVRACESGAYRNPSTPGQVLGEFANDSEMSVRRDIAANPSTPRDALARLAGDREISVRKATAGNPSTPSDALGQLAKDPDTSVRKAIAGNPSTLAQDLIELGSDSEVGWMMSCKLASNPSTPEHVMKRVDDGEIFLESSVRGGHLSRNSNIPSEILSDILDQLEQLRDCTVVGLADDLFKVFRNVCLTLSQKGGDYRDTLLSVDPSNQLFASSSIVRQLAKLVMSLQPDAATPSENSVLHAWFDFLQEGLDQPRELALASVTDEEFRNAFRILEVMPEEGNKRAIARACKSKDWLARAAATYAEAINPSLLKMLLEDPVDVVRQCAVARLRLQ